MDITERIEAYLQDEMSAEEAAAFEQLRASDPDLDQKVVMHEQFMKQIKEYGENRKLIAEMNAIHSRLDVAAVKEDVIPFELKVRTLWKKYRMSSAVAASVAVLAVFATLFSTGYFNKGKSIRSDYNALRREWSRDINNKVKRSQNEILQNINATSKEPSTPSLFGGTGFALNTEGYIVTNYHVVKDADSVYIEDNDGKSFKTTIVYVHPSYDIAVLKVTDSSFKLPKSLPYVFKRAGADLGLDVYTLGYPKDDITYTRGYLSSKSGYDGDTLAYQVDISVNGGNSGGPLLDAKGNVVGVVNAKQDRTDGASFAIKSTYLLEAIDAIPKDSLGRKVSVNTKNTLASLNRGDQIKKIGNYIYMVKVY
ncbi:MAG: S1C family serine protease [Arcticibacter sp.]